MAAEGEPLDGIEEPRQDSPSTTARMLACSRMPTVTDSRAVSAPAHAVHAYPSTRRGLGGASIRCERPIEPGRPTNAYSQPAESPPRLIERARTAMRMRHYNPGTEETYLGWMRRYYEFHGRRDLAAQLDAKYATASLNDLATRSHVVASTQNQALAALLLLYREVLGIDTSLARRPRPRQGAPRLPVVLSCDEVRAVLAKLEAERRLIAT